MFVPSEEVVSDLIVYNNLATTIQYVYTYLRAAAPAADPGKECEEAGEGQRLRTK